jgi:Ca-activated chloride channel family protein
MAMRWQRFFGRSEVALLILFLVAAATALMLGRWLAVIQEPPTRQAVGERLLATNRADEAAHVFEDKLWRGVALYRSSRYHRAVGEFVTDDSITGYYNMGNAYAHLGLYEGAIAAYEVVLARVPSHEDARFNLDLVREAAKRAQELEEESREIEEAGNWEDGLLEERQEAGGAPQPAAEDDEETPGSEESLAEEIGDGDQVEVSNAPPSSDGASGSEQQGQQAEATSLALTTGDEQDENGLTPALDDLEDRPIAPGTVDRQREEELADHILLRRIEDDPALVLKARLSMALRKMGARR